jgi:flagellin
MANSIISNIAALNAQTNIGRASEMSASSIARLSSGNRITKASDDVAGLATGTALRTQVTTLRTALSNASQGTSLLQVADGALSQIIDILQRQKAIAVQAASGQLTDANRALLNQEFTALTSEVDRISISTNFNGVSLLNGGLGSKTTMVSTNALAASAFVAAPSLGGGTVVASVTPIGVHNQTSGAVVAFAAATAGSLQFVDSAGTALANAQFGSINTAVYGQFSNFSLSNVNYGAAGVGSATLTATINGVQFTGNAVAVAANGTVTVSNGNTFIQLAVGAINLADAQAASSTVANITNVFSNNVIARANSLAGVNFEGTALDGSIGTATTGVASIRLTNNGTADISNFTYVANTGAANTSNLTVQVNGQTWTATAVQDNIVAGGNLSFKDATGTQVLNINTTGLTTGITNIRTSTADRANFIAALNTGFGRAGSGLNFTIGSTTTDNIRVQFGASNTSTIFNGASLDVNSAANATAASAAIDLALTSVVSLRATVGALQSRFNYASNAIESSIENQEAARSSLLDTDVSAESTAYASAQVQMQAGISVLAQANQLPQSLLKLLG